MISQQSFRLSVFKSLDSLKILVVLALTTWMAHFWHSASFGLYEDDFGRFANVMGIAWLELWDLILNESFGQGRPLHDGLIYLFLFLGLKSGGLHVVYWFGYAIVTINSFLFYLLLKRMFANEGFAIIGALAFCLFPADTTQPFLTHSLGVQPSLSLLLIALLFYLSERKKLSYLVILVSLFAYEPIFPVFLTAPLLKKKWDSRLIREWLSHAVVLGAIIVGVVILRKVIGEGRVSHFSILEVILLVGNPIVGPITSMSMFVYRPIETLLKLNGELLLLLPLCFVGFIWLLSRLKLAPMGDAFRLTTRFESRVLRPLKIPEAFNNFAKPVAIGLIMLVLAYPLTLTTLGFSTSGRGTRVHAAAVVGASILCACICSAILFAASKYGKKRLAILGLAGFFALLIGFGLRVQQDYQLMWQYQRGLWTDIIRLCPDITEGTVIFVEPTGMRDTRQKIPFRERRGVPDTRQIKANEWNLPYILDQIYQFPDDWTIPPRVYRLQSRWQEKILSDDNLFKVSAAVPYTIDSKRRVNSSNVILLETKNGKLTRRTEPLIIDGQQFRLKGKSASRLPPFQKGYLYDYLIQDFNEEPIDYLIGVVPAK